MREHAATRLLSEEDRIAGFIKATGGFAGRWKERAAKGMTDVELAEALAFELGIAGSSGGPDSLSLWFQGAGLRIWISWEIRNTRQTKPTFQGSPLFNAAAVSGSSEMLSAWGSCTRRFCDLWCGQDVEVVASAQCRQRFALERRYKALGRLEARELRSLENAVRRQVQEMEEAARIGLSGREYDRMSSAFEHQDLRAALRY